MRATAQERPNLAHRMSVRTTLLNSFYQQTIFYIDLSELANTRVKLSESRLQRYRVQAQRFGLFAGSGLQEIIGFGS